jgi:hypothetical protein
MIARRSLIAGTALGVACAPSLVAAQPDRATVLGVLMKLEVESWQFLKDRNVDAAKDYLADDALLIFGDGTIEPNADLRIWTKETATLLYRVTYAAALKDAKAVTMKAMASSTYASRGSRWLSVLYQETPIP